jgi:ubiquinone/menaquinone biosynthesis C-methylase UbiE
MGAYEKLALFYDRMKSDVPYETWLKYVFRIWRKLGKSPRTILDLACGTGSAAVILAERGLDVVGVDISEDMLKVAKKKSKNVKFILGDMTKLKLKKKFDAVVCIYDSLNYLLKESEIEDAFKGVYKILNKGGIFVFDVNTIYKITETWLKKGCTDFDYMHVCWQNNVDNETKINIVILDFFVKDKKNKFERFREVHKERGYSLEFLKKSLEKVGFSVKGTWDAFTFNPPHKASKRVYFAAVK